MSYTIKVYSKMESEWQKDEFVKHVDRKSIERELCVQENHK